MSYLATAAAATGASGSGAGGLASLFSGTTGKDWLNAGASVLGKGMSAAPTSATSGAGYLGSIVNPDHSGWTVSTGGGTAYGTPPALKSPTVYAVAGVAAVALVAFLIMKRKG